MNSSLFIKATAATATALVVASLWQAIHRPLPDQEARPYSAGSTPIGAAPGSNVKDRIDDSVTEHACPLGLRAVRAGVHLHRAARYLAHSSGQLVSEMGDKQVGGHLTSEGKKGMLLLAATYLLKPAQSGKRRHREVSFYEEVEAMRANNHGYQLCGLDRFLSVYHGAVRLGAGGAVELTAASADHSARGSSVCQGSDIENVYMVFTDATAAFRRPCVMDAKLGQRTYEPDAAPDKVARELSKYPRQAEAGFRFVGTRVCVPGAPTAVTVGKKAYQRVAPEGALDVLRIFFATGLGNRPRTRWRAVVAAAHAQVSALVQSFEQQTRFAFTSASLLLIYDAGSAEDESSEDDSTDVATKAMQEATGDLVSDVNGFMLETVILRALVDVRLIDVAHVRHGSGAVDKSTLFGLRRMASLLAQLLEET